MLDGLPYSEYFISFPFIHVFREKRTITKYLSEACDVLDDGRGIGGDDDHEEDEYPHVHPEANGQIFQVHRAVNVECLGFILQI